MSLRGRLPAMVAALGGSLAVAGAPGCVGVVAPLIPDDVASSLAARDMRRIETDDLVLTYPEGRQPEALRFLDRVEGCAAYEKSLARLHGWVADAKLSVILPEVPFNNAFSSPRLLGFPAVVVVPTYNTLDLFMVEGGLPPDPAIIGCHEITHAVHAQQIGGFPRFLNVLFGNAYTPQIGLDSWFHEGLAVYYETKLQPGVGRLAWPYWHGVFAASVAGRRLNGGDLSDLNREFFSGNDYVVGSEFVSFLAGRYGEQKLWDLISEQGRSFFFPLWVNLRFRKVYDKTLSDLIDEFADDVQDRIPVVARPPGQQVIREAGALARYARAADGTEAFIVEDRDHPCRLVVMGPEGTVRAEHALTGVLPPRLLKISSPRVSGALSFSGDGKSLYFVALDLDATYQASRLIRYDLASDELEVVAEDLKGTGGSITPDGAHYVYPRADGDHHDLAELDVRTGAVRVLTVMRPGSFVAGPRVSPDGRRVVATLFEEGRFQIATFDAGSGARLATLPASGGAVTGPAWADDQRIVYVGAAPDDPRFQVYLYELATGSTVKVTRAPYLAYEPQVAGGRAVRFLNREGGRWTLDEVALPAPVVAAPTAAAPLPTTTTPAVGAVAVPPAPAIAVAATPVAPLPSAAPSSVFVPQGAPALPPPVSAGKPPASVLATDRPASGLDGLFIPRLWGPTLLTLGRRGELVGLVLVGNDAQFKHRWAVTGYYDLNDRNLGFSAGYLNRQLAPFSIELAASQIAIDDSPPQVSGMPVPAPARVHRRERQALFDVQRSFYGNPALLGFALDESYRPDDVSVVGPPLQRFAGPFAFTSFTGLESTAYGGPRRLVNASLFAAIYPDAWATTPSGFTDLRVTATGVVPLPLLERHSLTMSVRARELIGLPDNVRLLQVGGLPAGLLWRDANRPEISVTQPSLLPSQISFVEGLRGFEDRPQAVNRIFIGDVTYRYPFVIDWGSASSLGILPSFFLSQIDLRLFGSGATTGEAGDRHVSAGGSLTAQFHLLADFSLQYQIGRRLTDDHGLVQLLILSAG